jgi:hypothetical protein
MQARPILSSVYSIAMVAWEAMEAGATMALLRLFHTTVATGGREEKEEMHLGVQFTPVQPWPSPTALLPTTRHRGAEGLLVEAEAVRGSAAPTPAAGTVGTAAAAAMLWGLEFLLFKGPLPFARFP